MTSFVRFDTADRYASVPFFKSSRFASIASTMRTRWSYMSRKYALLRSEIAPSFSSPSFASAVATSRCGASALRIVASSFFSAKIRARCSRFGSWSTSSVRLSSSSVILSISGKVASTKASATRW